MNIHVERTPDGWVASVVEYPGCCAVGDSPLTAVARALFYAQARAGEVFL